jgi:hypothetical protein
LNQNHYKEGKIMSNAINQEEIHSDIVPKYQKIRGPRIIININAVDHASLTFIIAGLFLFVSLLFNTMLIEFPGVNEVTNVRILQTVIRTTAILGFFLFSYLIVVNQCKNNGILMNWKQIFALILAAIIQFIGYLLGFIWTLLSLCVIIAYLSFSMKKV